MKASLVFSPIEHADVTLLLRTLNLNNSSRLEIQEDLTIKNRLEFHTLHTADNNNDDSPLVSRRVVVKALARLASSFDNNIELFGSLKLEKLLVEQWIEFAYDVAIKEVTNTNDIENRVFLPLHLELSRRTFIAGGQSATIADWALFSILFPRIKAMIPSVSAKYYRIIRWADHLQYLLMEKVRITATVDEKGGKEVSTFVPASFDKSKILAILDGLQVKNTTPLSKEELQKKKRNGSLTVKKDKEGGGDFDNHQLDSLHPISRVDLRVGKIVKVEKHPHADRLYVEHVDLGEEELRIVVSGLVEHVSIDELQDRLCVFICNLKPASLCKVLSSAMLLVAKTDDGAANNTLEPLIPPLGCLPGDRITIEGVTTVQPDKIIKPKDTTWENVRAILKVTNGVAHYENSPLIVNGKGAITSSKISDGIIS